jgi:hypothetical protein
MGVPGNGTKFSEVPWEFVGPGYGSKKILVPWELPRSIYGYNSILVIIPGHPLILIPPTDTAKYLSV